MTCHKSFRVVRFLRYIDRTERMILRSGLTFAEAKAHITDPSSSSRMVEGIAGMSRDEQAGDWFDGVEEEPP
jgi:hypothetical protein